MSGEEQRCGRHVSWLGLGSGPGLLFVFVWFVCLFLSLLPVGPLCALIVSPQLAQKDPTTQGGAPAQSGRTCPSL